MKLTSRPLAVFCLGVIAPLLASSPALAFFHDHGYYKMTIRQRGNVAVAPPVQVGAASLVSPMAMLPAAGYTTLGTMPAYAPAMMVPAASSQVMTYSASSVTPLVVPSYANQAVMYSAPSASLYMVPAEMAANQVAAANLPMFGLRDVRDALDLFCQARRGFGGGGAGIGDRDLDSGASRPPADGGEVTIRIVIDVRQDGASVVPDHDGNGDHNPPTTQLNAGDRIMSVSGDGVTISRNGQTLQAKRDNPGLRAEDRIREVVGSAGSARIYAITRGGKQIILRNDGSPM